MPSNASHIRIAGAGLAGLSTAIHLAQQGHRVDLFDKRADSGQPRARDWDAVENWTTTEDFLLLLRQRGITLEFEYYPPPDFEVYDPAGMCYPVKTDRPLFYLVKRGSQSHSLEQALKSQALDYGVTLYYNQSRSRQEVDVWATGMQHRGFFLNAGLTFYTSHADMVLALVNAYTAPKAYAYLIIVKGQGKLSVVLTRHFPQARRILQDTLTFFRQRHWFDMDDVRLTSGFGGQISAFKNFNASPIAVGEAAGFQDYLWGFGIRYALLSGYLAAQALDQGLDYSALTKTHIQPWVRTSMVNRLLYDTVGNRTYRLLIRHFSRSPDLTALLRRWYSGLPMRTLLWPIASASYR